MTIAVPVRRPVETLVAPRLAVGAHVSDLPAAVYVNRIVLAVCAVGVLIFLCLPVLIVVPMSFSNATSLQFPPEGFSMRW